MVIEVNIIVDLQLEYAAAILIVSTVSLAQVWTWNIAVTYTN
jgi:hypothetical protein